MALAVLSAAIKASTGGLAVTTNAVDTTGANLLVAVPVSYQPSFTSGTVTDSKGNSWTALTVKFSGVGRVRIFYSVPTSVGSGHTFTYDGDGGTPFPSLYVVAASGAHATPYESENGATTTGTSLQPGSVTPAEDGCLVITGLSSVGGNSQTIDGGFTRLQVDINGGNNLAAAGAYLIQGTAGAVNPTWSWSGSNDGAAVVAVFKPAATAGSFTRSPSDVPKNHGNNITVTLAGTSTTWAGGGSEFSLSGVAGVTKVSENVTSTTAATLVLTTGSTAGTLTITDGDGLTQTVTVSTATFGVSPTSGSTGTTPTLTLTGTHTLWSSETAAGLFSVSGGTGASVGTPTITTNTAGTAALTVGSAAGTLTVTDNSTGATASFTASVPPAQIAVNDAGLFFSPYNWLLNGSTDARTVNPGAYVKTVFSGTSCVLKVSVASLVSASVASDDYPVLAYSVDGVAFVRTKLTSATATVTLATGLADTTHTLELHFAAGISTYDRWTTPDYNLKITGFTLDPSKVVSSPTLLSGRMVVYGDSHAEGVEDIGDGVDVDNQDALQTFSALIGRALNCEYGIIGFAGQGYQDTGQGNVPELSNAWNLYWSGQSRLSGGLFSPAPDWVVSAHGHNDSGASDGTVQAAVESQIAAWRAAAPSAKIAICVPPGQQKRSAITAAELAAGDATSYLVDAAEDLLHGSYLQTPTNSVHLTVRGHARYGAILSAEARRLTGGGGGGSGGTRILSSGVISGGW